VGKLCEASVILSAGDIDMKNKNWVFVFCAAIFTVASFALAKQSDVTMTFTVSMEEPNTHYYHVVFRCEGIKEESIDFKMPVWTPGYYRIMDFAENVSEFIAEDGDGKELVWEKPVKNTWRVKGGEAENITISYNVYAFGRSVADSFFNEDKAYISPAAVFMYVAGRLKNPVTVTIKPYKNFKKISTGLDPVEGKENTFAAPNFDVLYDCPIFVDNQEIISFEVQGIPHRVAIYEPNEPDRGKLVSVLTRMIKSAVSVVGEVPYKHYTFIMMGDGLGGLEHRNSMAVFSNVPELEDPNDYKGWLSFITHEFFHLYNVKRIRPIALGPFDYDKGSKTNMLWFAEGGTVYYEYIILNRAGFMGRSEVLDRFCGCIRGYENSPGNRLQSVAESSYEAFTQPFFGGRDTVSYYDKGAALCMLLDLKIRGETKNERSLDDVMRTLYRKYYKELKRGFTDDEFQQVCEEIAGTSLAEFFEHVTTVKEIDYPKYLGCAGLQIEPSRELPEVYLGARTRQMDGSAIIVRVEWDSPAEKAGLNEEDEIIALDGKRINSQERIEKIIKSKRKGEKVRILICRDDMVSEVEAVLDNKIERSFNIKPIAQPNRLQSEILNDWLRE